MHSLHLCIFAPLRLCVGNLDPDLSSCVLGIKYGCSPIDTCVSSYYKDSKLMALLTLDFKRCRKVIDVDTWIQPEHCQRLGCGLYAPASSTLQPSGESFPRENRRRRMRHPHWCAERSGKRTGNRLWCIPPKAFPTGERPASSRPTEGANLHRRVNLSGKPDSRGNDWLWS